MMAPIMAAPAAMHGSMGSVQSNPLVECVKTGQRCERPVLLMGSFDSSAVYFPVLAEGFIGLIELVTFFAMREELNI